MLFDVSKSNRELVAIQLTNAVLFVFIFSLINDIFGSAVNPQAELPSMGKMVVLLWLFRDEDSVLSYLVSLIETVSEF